MPVLLIMSTPPAVGWGSTYCCTAEAGGVGVTPIAKGLLLKVFGGGMVFVPGHYLLIFAMTLNLLHYFGDCSCRAR